MKWNTIKDSSLFKPFKNIFGIGLLAFIIWMLFFDSNSLLEKGLKQTPKKLKNLKLKTVSKNLPVKSIT